MITLVSARTRQPYGSQYNYFTLTTRGNRNNKSSPNNDNNNALTTVPPRVKTHANPMQANIRLKTAGTNICGNEVDNDDISSVSFTSLMSE
jgi:hypothetical protein